MVNLNVLTKQRKIWEKMRFVLSISAFLGIRLLYLIPVKIATGKPVVAFAAASVKYTLEKCQTCHVRKTITINI